MTLAGEGMKTVLRRELRFLVEASIKMCFVQQQDYGSSLSEKLEEFKVVLGSPRLSVRELRLQMLSEQTQLSFIEEVGRLYGLTSSFVHWSPHQISERLREIEAGYTPGKKTEADVRANNGLIRRGLAISLVIIFHSVPEHVAGDLMVERDGSTLQHYFMASRYLAEIDSFFDYKHERKRTLPEIQRARLANIQF